MAKKQSVKKETPTITNDQLAGLRELMPQAFTEGKIDVDKLRASLGDFADEGPERYSFTWAGKRDAIRILQTPSRATLTPARKESIDFDKTQNIFIEGDNLEVLKLLYKPYFGQVKMIYIDPPYNTGNDFVYPDNFADPLDTYLKLTGQKDSEGNLLTSNAETSGRYHSAWLSMMFPRLFLARQLLHENGTIFVSVDERELTNLRALCNEVFGEECFVAVITLLCNPKGRSQDKYFATNHEYIVIYSKRVLPKGYYSIEKDEEQIGAEYPEEDDGGKYRLLELRNTHREFGRHNRKNLFYPFYVDSESGDVYLEPDEKLIKVLPIWDDGFEGCWTWDQRKSKKDLDFLVAKQIKGQWKIYRKSYASGSDKMLKTIFSEKEFFTEKGQKAFNQLFETKQKIFQSPKSPFLVSQLAATCTSKDDLIIDFFSGSSTTAQAVLELNREDGGNRKFILVQLPEPTNNEEFSTIAEIGKERIRRVIKKMKKEREGQLQLDKPEDLGFKVFKLAESNYKQWDDVTASVTTIHESSLRESPQRYAKQMEMLADPLVKGWKEDDVLYEVALKEGYGLNVQVEETESKGVQKVSDTDKGQSFYLCLADKVKLKDLKSLSLKKDDLFICRDIALDDESAANLALQCRLKTI
jgi:adenine-specific DNA-methyltransferase